MTSEKNDEISLKDIIIKIQVSFNYLLSKWYILILAVIFGGVLGFYISKNTKPEYIGAITFVLSSGSPGGGGALSGIASQFGLDQEKSNDIFSGDNILTLFKSKKMIKKALFTIPPGQNDVLANIIVKEWGWDKVWKNEERTKNLFPLPKDTAALTPVQDSLVREVYSIITNKNLSVTRKDRKLSVYEVSTVSSNEIFSCYLTRFLMEETARFYIDTKTRMSKQTLRMLQREADSLRGLLGGSITSTASEVDRTFNLNPALQVQKASIQKGQVRTTVLTTAYGEIVRNLELAKINLQNETPLYQIIDEPEIPLKKIEKSRLIPIIIWVILFLVLTSVYLLIRRRIILSKKSRTL